MNNKNQVLVGEGNVIEVAMKNYSNFYIGSIFINVAKGDEHKLRNLEGKKVQIIIREVK